MGYLVLFLATMSFTIEAQTSKIDSLKDQLIVYSIPDSNRVNILNDIAFEYLHKNPNILREYVKESQNITKNLNFPKGEARGLSVLAGSYWVEGEYNISLDYYLQALKIYNNINDTFGKLSCYNNMGEIYKKLEDFDLALVYLERALKINEDLLPERNPVFSYINIAEVYLKRNQLELAKSFFEKSLILNVESKDTKIKAYVYAGLGETYFKLADEESGLFYLKKSLRLREISNDLLGIIQSSLILGNSYVSLKKYKLSEELYLSAKSKAQELNAKEYEIIVYKRLFYLDSIKGNYKRALEYSSRHHALKDSLFTLEKESQLAKIETIYEVEKMDKENALLLKDKESNKNTLKYQRLINIGGGLSMIILAFLSIALLVQRKKQNKTHGLLKIQNDKILNQKNKLLVNANKLRELNENLERTVKDRTSIILTKNEKLKEFAWMNAHNVRGPLSNILGITYLLDKQTLVGEQKELVGHLKDSAKKLDNEFHLLRAQMEDEERA